MVEGITGPNTTTVTTVGFFKTVSQVEVDANTVGNVSIGHHGQDSISGQIDSSAPGIPLNYDGIISPLATGVILNLGENFNSANLGNSAFSLSHDSSNHIILNTQWYKDVVTGRDDNTPNTELGFSFFQRHYVFAAGALNLAGIVRNIGIQGWIEP